MKKIVYLLLVAVCGLIANPIDPSFVFSELKFDEDKNWQIEIHSLMPDVVSRIDSVVISSCTGKSKVADIVFEAENTSFFAIKNYPHSLEKSLNLNIDKDTLKIATYFKERYIGHDTFIFGAGSPFPITNTDMSIAQFFYDSFNSQMHTLGIGYNKNPSLGYSNDSTGNTCALYGKILDKNGSIIPNKTFWISQWPMFLTTDNLGNYRIRPLASRYNFNKLFYDKPLLSTTTPVNLIMIPGHTYYQDFVLDMTGISEQATTAKSPALLYNYPNPFNNQTAIYYEVPEGVKYNNASIRISNIKGESVAVLAANQKSGSVYWNADHNAAGMYIYQLLIDGKAVSSGEMVLLK